MAGRLTAPLAEALDLVERKIVAGQKQQAVQEHGTVSGRKDETVAIEPLRVARVVLRRKRVHSVYPMAAAPIGKPGMPEFAFCTASADKMRMVLMHRFSSSLSGC
jgi:hypothetical protein